MKKLLSITALLLCVSLCLTACSSGTQSESGDADNPYKDTIIWAISSDQDTLAPQKNVNNMVVMPQLYSGLLRIGMDGKVECDIAESYEVSEDNLTWTFHLRDDVTFHNGKQCTAQDFQNTFDRLLDEENPQRHTSSYSYIDYTEAVDDYTFVIKTKEPKGSFLTSIANQATFVLDIDYIEKYGSSLGDTAESVNGTGPYKAASWTKGEELVLEAYDGYYGGEPATKNVIMQVVPEQNSRAIVLETGEADIVSGLSPEDAVRLNEMDGITVSMTESNGCHLFQFNVASQNAPMSDPKVRQAISYAIDKETICETLFGGLGEEPMTGIVTSVVNGYVDVGVVPYDVEKAKELLAEAGYPDGFDMTIMTTSLYNRGVEMGEMIKAQLALVGIDATLDVVEGAVFNEALSGVTPDQFKWDMFIMGSGGDQDVDIVVKRIAQTSATGTNENNYGFYSNAELDALLEQGATTVDEEARLEIYKRVAEIMIYDDPFDVYMNVRKNVFGMSDKVEGFAVNPCSTFDLVNFKVLK